jgi:hypothetical protein
LALRPFSFETAGGAREAFRAQPSPDVLRELSAQFVQPVRVTLLPAFVEVAFSLVFFFGVRSVFARLRFASLSVLQHFQHWEKIGENNGWP